MDIRMHSTSIAFKMRQEIARRMEARSGWRQEAQEIVTNLNDFIAVHTVNVNAAVASRESGILSAAFAIVVILLSLRRLLVWLACRSCTLHPTTSLLRAHTLTRGVTTVLLSCSSPLSDPPLVWSSSTSSAALVVCPRATRSCQVVCAGRARHRCAQQVALLQFH